MKNATKNDKKRTALILGGAFVAAAWLISGPVLLDKWGISGKANGLLIWIPAMIVFFGSIAGDKKKLACERRAFKRLIGR